MGGICRSGGRTAFTVWSIDGIACGGVPYSLRVAHSSVRAYRTPFAGIPERYFHRSDQEDYGTECGEDREFCGAYHSRSGQCAGNHCADVYHLLLPERVDGGYLCGLHRL